MTTRNATRFQLLGIPIDSYTYDQWLDQIGGWIAGEEKRLHHICTLNPEFIVIAQHNPEFFNVLNQADACVADGTGIIIAAHFLRKHLPSRITGSDGIFRIAQHAATTGWRLFLLGAAPTIAEKVASILQNQFVGLQVVGTYAGSPANTEADSIIAMINASGADVLLVAYGAPRQDLWINQHREKLGVRVAMGVGGAFDYVVGIVPRAPKWMRQLGLEWLYRLIKQPWRWRRMMRLPMFVWLMLRYGEKPSKSAQAFIAKSRSG